jgi:hypothetical protein
MKLKRIGPIEMDPKKRLEKKKYKKKWGILKYLSTEISSETTKIFRFYWTINLVKKWGMTDAPI